MKTKISLATIAVAVAMLAAPMSAQASFDKGWRCAMFGWFDRTECKKRVVHKHHKKKYAKKAGKTAKM